MNKTITDILDQLKRIDGVKTSLVVDHDGLLIAEGSNQEQYSSESLASHFARAVHTFEKLTKASVKEDYKGISQLVVERQGQEKLIMFMTPTFILAVVTQGVVNLGLVRMEMREAIQQVLPLLSI